MKTTILVLRCSCQARLLIKEIHLHEDFGLTFLCTCPKCKTTQHISGSISELRDNCPGATEFDEKFLKDLHIKQPNEGAD